MNERIVLADCKRIVVKIGTTSLTYPNGKLNLRMLGRLAMVLSDLLNQGRELILVSSGAIAVGTHRLSLLERPRDIMMKQAASAVGQAVLMQIYERFFMEYNVKAAQILLTKDMTENDIREKNAKNTLFTLLKLGTLPIVNENDTVATEELNEFSDNDTLSAYVAVLAESDLLVILSDIDALYEEDPKTNPAAKRISIVKEIDARILETAGEAGSAFGTGGMITKINAAKMVTDAGIHMVIASGESPDILYPILNGEAVGTFFAAR